MLGEHDRRDVIGGAGRARADQRAAPLRLEVVGERLAGGVRAGADQRRGAGAGPSGARLAVPALRLRRETTSETWTGSGPSSQPSTAIAVSRSPPPLARRSSTTARAPRSSRARRRGTAPRARAGEPGDGQDPDLAGALGGDVRPADGDLGRVRGGPAARLGVGHQAALRHPLEVEVAADAPRLAPAARRRPRRRRDGRRRRSGPSAPSSAARRSSLGISRSSQPASAAAELVRAHERDAGRRSGRVDHRVDRQRPAGARPRPGGARRAARSRRRPPRPRSAAASRRAPRPARRAASGCGDRRRAEVRVELLRAARLERAEDLAQRDLAVAAAARDALERSSRSRRTRAAAATPTAGGAARGARRARRARLTREKARSASMIPEPVASMTFMIGLEAAIPHREDGAARRPYLPARALTCGRVSPGARRVGLDMALRRRKSKKSQVVDLLETYLKLQAAKKATKGDQGRAEGRQGHRRLQGRQEDAGREADPDHRRRRRGRRRDGSQAALLGRRRDPRPGLDRPCVTGRAGERGGPVTRSPLAGGDLDPPRPRREHPGDRQRVLLRRLLVDPERVLRAGHREVRGVALNGSATSSRSPSAGPSARPRAAGSSASGPVSLSATAPARLREHLAVVSRAPAPSRRTGAS